MIEQIKKQIALWHQITTMISIKSLAILLVSIFFDLTTIIGKVVGTVIVVTVGIAVAWWFWALNKILYLSSLLISAEAKFEEVEKEIKEVRKDLKFLDSDNKK